MTFNFYSVRKVFGVTSEDANNQQENNEDPANDVSPSANPDDLDSSLANTNDLSSDTPTDESLDSVDDTSDDMTPIEASSASDESSSDPIIETPVPTYQNEKPPMATTTPPPTPPNTSGNFEEWTLDPSGAWPPPIFIKRTTTPRERFYLEYRWHSQWAFYDTKATQNKSTYYWYQRIVVIGSLIIPALVSLNSTIARFIADAFNMPGPDAETMIRIGVDSVTVFISLAVAGSAALESLYKYGENWSSYRSAAEELQAEKNFYDMGAGPYQNNPTPFATFVTRIEGIIANQNGKYFQAVQSQIAKQAEQNDNLVEAFLTGDDDDDENEREREQIYATTPPPDIG